MDLTFTENIPENTNQEPKNPFTVVAIGGLAGGLEAYIRLLKHLPADMGVAIVIVNHLRKVATMLHVILPNHTLYFY